ncbi:MAG: thymidine phosphorylase, partial [Abditibacteriota bacterium]|nr:thymidine phosphorylase [Abditibacteriota bacterium]
MKTYIPTDIIAKKRDKKQLTAEEIRFLVDSYTDGLLPDYQMASFLMAVYLNGMNDEETAAMTDAMVNSGDILDFSEIEGIKADKHSTGGVGDKTTLVLVPILAAAGVKTVKMSGRGLGFTGGTIDKLQSIKGYRTALTEEEIHRELRTLNAVMIGATGDIAPADKKIYALRDVTATVESIPLIASSIMSKKIACGADVIVIDIKVGSGAFMKTMAEAEELSRRLIKIGESFGRRVDTVFGSMDDVLGYAVGNLLEVREALETLRGRGPRDLTDLCLEIAQKIIDAADIKADAAEILASGKALEYFGK